MSRGKAKQERGDGEDMNGKEFVILEFHNHGMTSPISGNDTFFLLSHSKRLMNMMHQSKVSYKRAFQYLWCATIDILQQSLS